MRLERLLVACVFMFGLAACTSQQNGLLRKPASGDAENAARIHTELGQRYLQQGMLKNALQKLKLALQFDDDYAPAHTVIAVIYERIGELKKAEQHYHRAVELQPKKGDTNNNFGAFLCREHKPQQALKYFRQALKDPFYATPDAAMSNEGICLLQMGEKDKAEADFRKALKINPQNGDALFHMAAMLHRRGDDFRASAFLQRFDALGQETPAGLLLGYRIESRLGNAEDARGYAQRLRKKFPDSDQAGALDNATEATHDSPRKP